MSILYTAPEVAPRGAVPLILLDADYLAYMIGGISQAADRNPDTKGQRHICVDEETDRWVWVDPIELVHWRIDNEIDKLKDKFGSDSIEVWLTPHEGNFRYDVAVSRPYKSGRSSPRPFYYQAIREHLLHSHQATVALGCEADDMVCTRQMDVFLKGSTDSVIVGPDKDLKCMFGRHYDPRKDIEEWITWEKAALNFYGQMITGDSVDSIPGCKGRGPKFWEGLKADFEHEYDIMPLTIQASQDLIQNLHESVWQAYYTKGHDMAYFLEQANLLHMRRTIQESWHVDYDWERGYLSIN